MGDLFLMGNKKPQLRGLGVVITFYFLNRNAFINAPVGMAAIAPASKS